jgi:hypothetical protein
LGRQAEDTTRSSRAGVQKNFLTNDRRCAIIKAQSGDAITESQQSRNATHLTPLEWTMVESPREPHKTVN